MVYYTPLEEALERELCRGGIPFVERTLIQDEVFSDFFRRQSSVERIISDKIFKVFERRGINLTDWRERRDPKRLRWEKPMGLLSRTTKSWKDVEGEGDLVLDYWISPTAKNKDFLKKITDYDELVDEVDLIIAERKFAREGFPVERIFFDEAEDDSLGVSITFEPYRLNRTGGIHIVNTSYGKEVSRDIFRGIVSPIRQADLIAQRAVDYLLSLKRE